MWAASAAVEDGLELSAKISFDLKDDVTVATMQLVPSSRDSLEIEKSLSHLPAIE